MLSVKTFHDRIRHIESELRRHGIAFEWIFEHDADELTPGQIDAVFAPSDMKRGHQSLVLKHIETWKRCVERDYRRVLVFEDDAVLARDFERVFALAMDEADRVDRPYMVYLGCGDNKYVAGARSSPTMLLTPGIELPATDATVLDRRAAELRLAYVAARKVTRPADWLMREADAAMGITQFWLREPIVEQGSMNGRFIERARRQAHGPRAAAGTGCASAGIAGAVARSGARGPTRRASTPGMRARRFGGTSGRSASRASPRR